MTTPNGSLAGYHAGEAESMHLILVDEKVRAELRDIIFNAMCAMLESELDAVLDATFEHTFERALGTVLQRRLQATVDRKLEQAKK